ncbi:MAG: acyl-CoA dehydrogenase family protein [Acidimicrobiia bacterium]
MDFSFSSDQQDLRELATKILGDATTLERTKQVIADQDGFDRDLWKALADAGLIGISLPESVGGGGLGFLETCIVLEEVGRTAAPIPALAVMGLAAPALAQFGATDALAGVADGTRIVTAALTEAVGDAHSPATTATDGKLTGTKVCVPAGLWAECIIVSAADGIYLVDPSASGVTVTREETMLGAPTAQLVLDGAPATKLAGPEGLTWLLERAITAMAVTMSGAANEALDLTASYVKEREQFNRKIATFQAVSQRTADTYINKEAIKLTAWQAAWRLDTGLDASTQVDTAKYWAAQGGQDVLLAAHHLHGGVGVDRDYPLHRYFLLAKQLELDLGSETPTLVHLGGLLADTPVG